MTPFVIFVAAVVAAFVAGVVFSQKIKDWTAGVPASLCGDLNLLQAHVVAQVSAAQKRVVADIHAAVLPATPTLSAAKTLLSVVPPATFGTETPKPV